MASIQHFQIRQRLRDEPVSNLLSEISQNPRWHIFNEYYQKVVETMLGIWQKALREDPSVCEEPIHFMRHSPISGRSSTFFKERCYIHLNKSRERDPDIGIGGSSRVKYALLISANEERKLTFQKVARKTSFLHKDGEDLKPRDKNEIEVLDRILSAPSEMRENIINVHFYHIVPSKKGCKKLAVFMDYCPNGSLEGRDLSGGGLSRIVRQVLNGVKNLHALGIVHCDLKEDNILFDAKRDVCIADFDISVLVGTEDWKVRDLPPETAISSTAQTPLDIWAVGKTLVELILFNSRKKKWFVCLNNKYSEESKKIDEKRFLEKAIQLHMSYLQHMLKALHEINEPVYLLLEGLLQEDPAKRLSASEALERLENIHKILPIQNLPKGLSAPEALKRLENIQRISKIQDLSLRDFLTERLFVN